MADNDPGVKVPASPPEGTVPQDVTPAAPSPAEPGVTSDSPTGRTLENLAAEMHRRDQELRKQMESVLAYLASGAVQPKAASATSQPATEPSDDDLWALAQQGDRQAFTVMQERIADRRVNRLVGQQSHAGLINAQLNAIVTRYPVLRDAAHPLTQTVHQAYALLRQAGYPDGNDTLLEATKTAIADRPDIITELYSQAPHAREQTRQSAATRAQTGVTGSTVRQSAPAAPAPHLTSEEAKLAARMGVKDPKGAKERFLKRQEAGQSSLGAVGGFPAVIAEMEGFDK